VIQEFAKKHNLPKYRIDQFNQQFFQQAIESFDELSNWGKDLRDSLKEEVEFMVLEQDRVFESENKDTVKVLFKRKDGQRIETVLMRHHNNRNTVCVSCMVGCPVNCSFCATGKMGFGGNLSAREIVDQVMFFQRRLVKQGKKVTNVVYMGMGEPMLNLPEVQKSLEIFTDPSKLGMSSRRFTISTSGYIPQFRQLIKDGYRGKVAISLHAPNQELREELMPVAKLHPLGKLMKALDEYVELTNKRITYEYVMISDVNDQPKHAKQLAALLSGRLAHVNLIPFNPIKEEVYERSSGNSIQRFKRSLENVGIPVTIRATMGDDVDAACGQLADRENKHHTGIKIGNL